MQILEEKKLTFQKKVSSLFVKHSIPKEPRLDTIVLGYPW